MRQYLENGKRYVHSYKILSNGTKIGGLGWLWTAISSNFRRISRDFADLGSNNC